VGSAGHRKAEPQSRTEATMSFCRFVESAAAESRHANRIVAFLSIHLLALAKQNEFPSQQLSVPSKLNVQAQESIALADLTWILT
jgi:hypothetical protein